MSSESHDQQAGPISSRLQLLLEAADVALARRTARGLRRSGFRVRHCNGPRPGGGCPLLDGDACPLVDESAVVIHALPSSSGGSVLRALRRERKPVVVLTEPDGAPAGLTNHQLAEEVRRTYASRARSLKLPVVLADGRKVVIRAIRPRDAGLLRAFDTGLSESSRRFRYLGWMRPLSEERAVSLASVDFRDRFALVALAGSRRQQTIVGECRLVPMPEEEGRLEIAIAVADVFQGAGLGRILLGLMMRVAADRGVAEVVAEVRYDNVRMMHLLRDVGFQRAAWELGVVTFRAGLADQQVEPREQQVN